MRCPLPRLPFVVITTSLEEEGDMKDTVAAQPRKGWTLALALLGVFMIALDTLVCDHGADGTAGLAAQ
jgi:hypothetical protein